MYLKKAEFNREPLYQKFRLREPFRRPILSSDPSILVHQLQSHDQFIIFASDGLWEHLSNQDAVAIVQNHPRSVRPSLSLSLCFFILNVVFDILIFGLLQPAGAGKCKEVSESCIARSSKETRNEILRLKEDRQGSP